MTIRNVHTVHTWATGIMPLYTPDYQLHVGSFFASTEICRNVYALIVSHLQREGGQNPAAQLLAHQVSSLASTPMFAALHIFRSPLSGPHRQRNKGQFPRGQFKRHQLSNKAKHSLFSYNYLICLNLLILLLRSVSWLHPISPKVRKFEGS